MYALLAIAAGGGLGSVLRHVMNGAMGSWTANFPWGIFAVNVLGSFIMGILTGLFAYGEAVPQTLRLFLTVGILGGFTTFSTFSLDTALLIQRGTLGAAVFYSLGSVIAGVGALFCGLALARLYAA